MTRSRRITVLLIATIVASLTAVAGASALHAQEVERLNRSVPASQDGWIDSGITLADGETATLTAIGRASWDGNLTSSGPEGAVIEWCQAIAPGLPVGALLARVGEAAPVVAAGATISGPGRVALAYNDCPGQYFDNSGSFSATLDVTRVAAAPAPQAQPVAQEANATKAEGGSGRLGMILLAVLVLLALALGAAFVAWKMMAARTLRFDPSAQLESSAWIAPVTLLNLQGERMPKRNLTIGGPDADVDFGVEGVRARLVPTEDGGTRIEMAGNREQVYVNDMPLILGQRLGSGYRVRIGVREFVYREDRNPRGRVTQSAGNAALDRPDPRAAA